MNIYTKTLKNNDEKRHVLKDAENARIALMYLELCLESRKPHLMDDNFDSISANNKKIITKLRAARSEIVKLINSID